MALRFATFNILDGNVITNNIKECDTRYDKSRRRYFSERYNAYELDNYARYRDVLNIIDAEDYDIVFLQEVSPHMKLMSDIIRNKYYIRQHHTLRILLKIDYFDKPVATQIGRLFTVGEIKGNIRSLTGFDRDRMGWTIDRQLFMLIPNPIGAGYLLLINLHLPPRKFGDEILTKLRYDIIDRVCEIIKHFKDREKTIHIIVAGDMNRSNEINIFTDNVFKGYLNKKYKYRGSEEHWKNITDELFHLTEKVGNTSFTLGRCSRGQYISKKEIAEKQRKKIQVLSSVDHIYVSKNFYFIEEPIAYSKFRFGRESGFLISKDGYISKMVNFVDKITPIKLREVVNDMGQFLKRKEIMLKDLNFPLNINFITRNKKIFISMIKRHGLKYWESFAGISGRPYCFTTDERTGCNTNLYNNCKNCWPSDHALLYCEIMPIKFLDRYFYLKRKNKEDYDNRIREDKNNAKDMYNMRLRDIITPNLSEYEIRREKLELMVNYQYYTMMFASHNLYRKKINKELSRLFPSKRKEIQVLKKYQKRREQWPERGRKPLQIPPPEMLLLEFGKDRMIALMKSFTPEMVKRYLGRYFDDLHYSVKIELLKIIPPIMKSNVLNNIRYDSLRRFFNHISGFLEVIEFDNYLRLLNQNYYERYTGRKRYGGCELYRPPLPPRYQDVPKFQEGGTTLNNLSGGVLYSPGNGLAILPSEQLLSSPPQWVKQYVEMNTCNIIGTRFELLPYDKYIKGGYPQIQEDRLIKLSPHKKLPPIPPSLSKMQSEKIDIGEELFPDIGEEFFPDIGEELLDIGEELIPSKKLPLLPPTEPTQRPPRYYY